MQKLNSYAFLYAFSDAQELCPFIGRACRCCFLRNQWRHTTIIEWRVVSGSRSLQRAGVTLSRSCACKVLCSQATSNHILMSHPQRDWGLLPFKVLTWNQQKRPGVGPPDAISGFLKSKRSIKNSVWKKYSSYLDPFGSNSELRHTWFFF
jgi:hypothetical protein